MLKSVYTEIVNALNDLLVDIGDRTPTRTELWQMKKYLHLRQVIEQQIDKDARHQTDLLDTVLPQVFEEIIGRSIESFGADGVPTTPIERKTVIDTAWSGENYSTRIHTNSAALIAHLEKDITDVIVMGKNPEAVKAKLRDDLGMSYRQASRLIRTETAFIYNDAAIKGYKSWGVKKVKYLHGEGLEKFDCDCAELDGKIFTIGSEPTLPRHPNCKCCYAPIIEKTEENSSTQS
jgi:SPP1 gp7 family putative phage head morphogenesis protein